MVIGVIMVIAGLYLIQGAPHLLRYAYREERNEAQDCCSFCHQPGSKVEKLIAGEGGIAICNRCVRLSYEAFRQQGVDMTIREQSQKNDF